MQILCDREKAPCMHAIALLHAQKRVQWWINLPSGISHGENCALCSSNNARGNDIDARPFDTTQRLRGFRAALHMKMKSLGTYTSYHDKWCWNFVLPYLYVSNVIAHDLWMIATTHAAEFSYFKFLHIKLDLMDVSYALSFVFILLVIVRECLIHVCSNKNA